MVERVGDVHSDAGQLGHLAARHDAEPSAPDDKSATPIDVEALGFTESTQASELGCARSTESRLR